MSHDSELDILEVILLACKAGGLNADTAYQIESSIRAEYGGLRIRIPKRKKYLTEAQYKQLFQDGLTNTPTKEIAAKYKIDCRTVYRIMKRGG